MKWIILLIGIFSNASASVLMKKALNPQFKLPMVSSPSNLMGNWPLLLGISLYGLAFILYAAALKFFPLNIAHPILTAGAIALVAVISVLVLGEPMSTQMFLGIGLIMIGVILLTSG